MLPEFSRDPAIGGETQGDRIRHVYARGGFMNELLAHETTIALFDTWREWTGLGALADGSAHTLEAFATTRGFAGRGEIARRLAAGALSWDDLSSDVHVSLDAFLQRYHALENDTAPLTRLGTEARAFCEAFGAPWPWLVLELLTAFRGSLDRRIWDIPVVRPLWAAEHPDDPAPPVQYTFQPRAHESAADVAVRFEAETATIHERLESAIPPPFPRGRLPGKTVPRYYEIGRWLARQLVYGESIRQITLAEFADEERRKDVRVGIRDAQRLLSESRYAFREDRQDP